MKIILLFTVSLNALDFVGIDNDETLTILSRANRGVGRGRKFGDFYNKLKSKTKLILSTHATVTQPTVGTSTTTKSIEYLSNTNSSHFAPPPRVLGPFESAFEYSLENFDTEKVAQSDPVYQETQAKINDLTSTIANFGRNIDLSRKLVVDKTWKELDKFTKLMEMIMYLQYEPVFGKYCFYGCWCMPTGANEMTKNWGQPVDEIDATCRDMQMCYKCAKIDYGNDCKDTAGYRYRGYEVKGERRIKCLDKEDTCKRAICECDKRLAMDLAKLEDTASYDFHSKYGSFNFKEQCVPQCKNCHKWDSCCGKYPERYPYYSDNGAKQCCGQKTYYKSASSCCPNDRLQPYGTCQYGY